MKSHITGNEIFKPCIISKTGLISENQCNQTKSIHSCSSLCQLFGTEPYFAIDTGEPQLTEVGRGKVFNFARDLFLPNIYDCLYCNVKKFDVEISSLTKINIDLEFEINKRIQRDVSEKELFASDEWKCKSVGISKKDAPLLNVFTLQDTPIQVDNNRYYIDKDDEPVTRIGNILYTWLPFSKAYKTFIDVSGRPEFNGEHSIIGPEYSGRYFVGRNNCIFGKLHIGKTYKFTITCNYDRYKFKNENIGIPIAIFFPFPYVAFEKFTYSVDENMVILPDSKITLFVPYEGKEPRLFLIPLDPNKKSISASGYIQHPLNEVEDNFHYDQYSIFMCQFLTKVVSEFVFDTKWSNVPIMLGIYNSVNEVYNNQYAPVKLFVYNNNDKIKRLKIVTSIISLSDKNTQQISVKAHEGIEILLAPVLKEERIKTILEISDYLLRVQVFDQCGTLLYDDSHKVRVLPRETYIPELSNGGGDWKLDLHSFIARWITPHAQCIDEIIAKAGLAKGMSGILSDDEEQMLGEIKAIYDEISQDIRYVSRSMSYGANWYKTQRVSLPSTTIHYKSGNCIDLSVLLASCLESLKFHVFIAMLKGHALIKIKFSDIHYECIETTYMGKREFCDALTKGREIYEKNFNKNGDPINDGVILVDIETARKSQIIPME